MRALNVEGTSYPLLRHLTLPVVAVTASADGCANAFIANSAQRASLVPSRPRISFYASKPNFSHDLVWNSGVFGIHLLRTDQWELIWQLGLQSSRDTDDKLAGLDLRTGETGCPLLVDCLAAFECRVINAMDTGASTFFLGDVVSYLEGPPGDVMTSHHFRSHMPPDKLRAYESRLAHAQEYLEPLSGNIENMYWPGPSVQP